MLRSFWLGDDIYYYIPGCVYFAQARLALSGEVHCGEAQ
jgi:hypothetical protein